MAFSSVRSHAIGRDYWASFGWGRHPEVYPPIPSYVVEAEAAASAIPGRARPGSAPPAPTTYVPPPVYGPREPVSATMPSQATPPGPAAQPQAVTPGPTPSGPFTPAVPTFKPEPGPTLQSYYGPHAGYPSGPGPYGATYIMVREPFLPHATWYQPVSSGLMLEPEIRNQFVAKVLSLLTATLVVTVMVALAFRTVAAMHHFVLYHPWTVWAAFSLGLANIICLSCSERLRRSYPLNMACLGIFVLSQSVLVGVITAAVSTDILLLALAIATAITTSLVLYALHTKSDFTVMGGSLFSMLVALLVVLIMGSFWHVKAVDLFVSALAAVLFSIYIVFDVQMMTGGEHLYSLSVDEYVFATLNLYLDIINLFVYILRLLNIWRMDLH